MLHVSLLLRFLNPRLNPRISPWRRSKSMKITNEKCFLFNGHFPMSDTSPVPLNCALQCTTIRSNRVIAWQRISWYKICCNVHISDHGICYIDQLTTVFCSFEENFTLNPCRPNPGRREKKIKLNVYFHTSLWCLKMFYEGLKGLPKTFWVTTKKCENKNLT